MTRDELRTEIMVRAQDSSNVIAAASVYNGWINQAIKAIARAWNWPFLEKTDTEAFSAGDNIVDLNTDVRAIRKVSYASGTTQYPLAPIKPRVMKELYPDSSATGSPQVYTDGGYAQTVLTSPPVRQLKIAPVPDVDYTLTVSYIMEPPALSTGTHYPPFPVGFDEAIIQWCLVQVARLMSDFESAESARRAFKEEIDELIAVYSDWQVEKFEAINDDDTFSQVGRRGAVIWWQ